MPVMNRQEPRWDYTLPDEYGKTTFLPAGLLDRVELHDISTVADMFRVFVDNQGNVYRGVDYYNQYVKELQDES